MQRLRETAESEKEAVFLRLGDITGSLIATVNNERPRDMISDYIDIIDVLDVKDEVLRKAFKRAVRSIYIIREKE